MIMMATTVTTTTTTTTVLATAAAVLGVIATVFLVVMLCVRELTAARTAQGAAPSLTAALSRFVTVAILPLALVFAAIVITEVLLVVL